MGVVFTLLLVALVAAPSQGDPLGQADPLGAVEAEALVRQVYYEGLPLDEARRIGPAGADRLAHMLADPAEAPHHANIVMALATSGQPGAFDALQAWARQPRVGEVDRATFRAWRALPHALGQLADADSRAIDRLAVELDGGTETWTFRHYDAARLARLRRRAAATSLAMTGRPEAVSHLRRARRATSDLDLRAHLFEVEALHAERGLAPTTIATMLRKMEDKGVVEHRAEGRQFVYRPTVTEDEVRQSMVGELVERLFDGDAKALVAHLVSEHEIDPVELAALRRRLRSEGREEGDD